MAGPLQGLKVIEMAGIGPGPFACMLLSDLGAEVTRITKCKYCDSAAAGNCPPRPNAVFGLFA